MTYFAHLQDSDGFELIRIGRIVELTGTEVESCVANIDDSVVGEIVRQTEKLIHNYLAVLDHFFCIGAVRDTVTTIIDERDSSPTAKNIETRRGSRMWRNRLSGAICFGPGGPPQFDWSESSRRHVGNHGQRTWGLERSFAHFPMLPAKTPYFNSAQVLNVASVLQSFSNEYRDSDERLQHIWQAISDEHRGQLSMLVSTCNAKDASADEREKIAVALNSAIDNDALSNTYLWIEEHVFEPVSDDDPGGYSRDYIDDQLSLVEEVGTPEGKKLLRRVLIESALKRAQYLRAREAAGDDDVEAQLAISEAMTVPPVDTCQYLFESYVCYWCEKLLGVSIVSLDSELLLDRRHRRLESMWLDAETDIPPLGMLCDSRAVWTDPDPKNLFRFVNPCFGEIIGAPQSPEQMSAGFHQLTPVIVQLGAMCGGAILAVENPEVHLHPSLQLATTEMFVQHATTGRLIIIETHSDLVVRRVMRAILSGEIPQQSAVIYFVDKGTMETVDSNGNVENRVGYSTLSPLRVNELGQIDNWPRGFLDEDIGESQRLMDAVYGNLARTEENEVNERGDRDA
jgi:hypothetical protein